MQSHGNRSSVQVAKRTISTRHTRNTTKFNTRQRQSAVPLPHDAASQRQALHTAQSQQLHTENPAGQPYQSDSQFRISRGKMNHDLLMTEGDKLIEFIEHNYKKM